MNSIILATSVAVVAQGVLPGDSSLGEYSAVVAVVLIFANLVWLIVRDRRRNNSRQAEVEQGVWRGRTEARLNTLELELRELREREEQ